MTQRLAGQVALVTGAAGGIGGAIAARFADEGCRIIALDRVEAPSGDLRLQLPDLTLEILCFAAFGAPRDARRSR